MKTIVKSKYWIIFYFLIFLFFYFLFRQADHDNIWYASVVYSNVSSKSMFLSAVTTQFIHISFLHLIINCIFLLYVNKETSKYWSTLKNIYLSIFGILFVAFCIILFAPKNITYMGSSGWIGCMLASCFIASLKKYSFKLNKQNIELFCISLLFIILPFIDPTISILMHISGYICGITFELLLGNKLDK